MLNDPAFNFHKIILHLGFMLIKRLRAILSSQLVLVRCVGQCCTRRLGCVMGDALIIFSLL